ncbi:MAG: hypothetical protein QW039_00100 [Fervidicoccaceae archaeon]
MHFPFRLHFASWKPSVRIATGAYRVLHGIQIKDNDFKGRQAIDIQV